MLSGGLKCQNFFCKGEGRRARGGERNNCLLILHQFGHYRTPFTQPPRGHPAFSLPPSFFLFCSHGSNRKPALCLPERFQNTQFPVKGTLFGKQKQTKRRTLGRGTARWGEKEKEREKGRTRYTESGGGKHKVPVNHG